VTLVGKRCILHLIQFRETACVLFQRGCIHGGTRQIRKLSTATFNPSLRWMAEAHRAHCQVYILQVHNIACMPAFVVVPEIELVELLNVLLCMALKVAAIIWAGWMGYFL